jgi:hypothetical protein
MGRLPTIAAVTLVALIVAAANTSAGRQWLEDRMDTVRWFINEVKTLHPSLAPR